MFPQFENFQKAGKEQFEATVKALNAISKGLQTLAIDAADYSKKSFENATAAVEKLASVKSLDKAFEVQTDYLKSSYEGFVAYATKVGEFYQGFAKDVFKPFEPVTQAPTPTKSSK